MKVSVPFVVDKALHCMDAGRRSVTVIVIHPPIRPRLWRTSRFRRHRRPLWGSTRVVLDAGEMGEEVVRRLITNSIRLLMNMLVLIPCANSSNRQRTQALHPRNPLGARMLTLVHPSLHFLGSLAISCLLHLHTNVALYSHTIPSIAAMTSGSIGTSSINTSPVGEHLEKRTSDLTTVHIFILYKIYVMLSEKRTQESS